MNSRRKLLYFYYIIVSVLILWVWYQLSKDYSLVTSRSRNWNTTSEKKYILVWTEPTTDPIINLGIGQRTFIDRRCPTNNCFVLQNRNYFTNLTDFDALIFHTPDLVRNLFDLPPIRASHQLYVFASMESSGYYPICKDQFNNYFNRTWTYKLNSDEIYGYIIIKNRKGQVIGPKEVMHWKDIATMKPINNSLKIKLSRKKYAVAWFVSNCKTPSQRENIARNLELELKKYGLTLHIYGYCGIKSCASDIMEECFKMVEREYYFYLSFENSFSEDYVTEKLLRPLQHYTVPIVYGGANYTRFMPDGIYLEATKTNVAELAKQIKAIIEDKEKYYNFFKWHNYYSYHDVVESAETDPYCKLCAMINYKTHTQMSTDDNLMKWWNPPDSCGFRSWLLDIFMFKYF